MAQQTEYLATFLEQTGASIPQFCRKMYFLVMPFLASTYHIEMNFWSKIVNIEVFEKNRIMRACARNFFS